MCKWYSFLFCIFDVIVCLHQHGVYVYVIDLYILVFGSKWFSKTLWTSFVFIWVPAITPVFSGIHVIQSVVFCVVFCLPFYLSFLLGHCFVCPPKNTASLYFQTLLKLCDAINMTTESILQIKEEERTFVNTDVKTVLLVVVHISYIYSGLCLNSRVLCVLYLYLYIQ